MEKQKEYSMAPPIPVEITPIMLERIASVMPTKADAAAIFGITRQALHLRMSSEVEGVELTEAWDRGFGRARYSLRQKMWAEANKGVITMMIFLSKQPSILGFTDRAQLDVGGTDGVPIEITFNMGERKIEGDMNGSPNGKSVEMIDGAVVIEDGTNGGS